MPLVTKQFSDIITFSRASTATYTNSSGVLTSAASGFPRLDYDPVTLAAKGLLIEEQRTNLLTYSEQFDNAAWGKTNSTVTANAVVAPDGNTAADKIQETAVTGYFVVASNPSGSYSTTYTWSCYAKSSERNFLAFNFSVVGVSGSFNLTTGATTINGGSPVLSATYIGNGWWRCIATFTTPASGSNVLYNIFGPALGASTTNYAGTAGSGIYIWGAQLEAGSFPTSYIPTTSAQVTRAADVAYIDGTRFSNWYRQDEGTLYVEFSRPYSGAVQTAAQIAYLSDNTTSNRIAVFVGTGSTAIEPRATNGGTTYLNAVNQAGSITAADQVKKSALAVKAGTGGGILCTGGTLGTAGDIASWPPATAITQMTIGSGPSAGTQPWNGHIKRITYYPRRLSNSELQALTA